MSVLRPYASRTADLLAHPPTAGENRHEWIFRVQAHLIRQGFKPEDVEKRMEDFCVAAGWQDRLPEVARNTAAITQNEYKGTPEDRISWPPVNHDARRARYGHPRMFDFQDTGLTPAHVLGHLYATDAWICAAPDRFRSRIYRLDELRPQAHAMQYVVANAMAHETGRTRAGKTSARSKDNACREADRRWAVVEFDTGDAPEDQIAVLSSLHSPATPLVMAVWSGGKSIHGWYDLSALRRDAKRLFYQHARHLGADNALWNTAALVRMPGGRRDTGEDQPILYFQAPEDTCPN